MLESRVKRDLTTLCLTAFVTAAFFSPAAVAQSRNMRIMRPNRWFVSTSLNEVTRQETHRMLYLAQDGTMLVVQCAARDGEKTGGWAITVTRRGWNFPTDFVEGWWDVEGEPVNGPLRWGGSGQMLLLNEDSLRDRLMQPVEGLIRLRVVREEQEWNVELSARDLDASVERFAPSCQVT